HRDAERLHGGGLEQQQNGRHVRASGPGGVLVDDHVTLILSASGGERQGRDCYESSAAGNRAFGTTSRDAAARHQPKAIMLRQTVLPLIDDGGSRSHMIWARASDIERSHGRR